MSTDQDEEFSLAIALSMWVELITFTAIFAKHP